MTTRTPAQQAAYFASAPADDDLDDLRDLLRLCARQTKDYFSAQDLTPQLYDKPRDVLENWGYKVLVDGKLRRMVLRGWLNNSGFGLYALTRAGRALVEESMVPKTPKEIIEAMRDEEAARAQETQPAPCPWQEPEPELTMGQQRLRTLARMVERLKDYKPPKRPTQRELDEAVQDARDKQAGMEAVRTELRAAGETGHVVSGIRHIANERDEWKQRYHALDQKFDAAQKKLAEVLATLEQANRTIDDLRAALFRKETREEAYEAQRETWRRTHAQSGAD